MKKKPIIRFYCHPDSWGVIPEPCSASKCVPDWYKKIKPKLPDEKKFLDQYGLPSLTAKKCWPMLDAMTAGYVMPTMGDIRVKTNEDCSEIEIKNPDILKVAEFHSPEQLGGPNSLIPGKAIKFLNHWVIETRPGWSTLFLPLMNDLNETRFRALAAIVDTDKYCKEINFPVLWTKPNFDDIVPGGTPVVVAIPVHRKELYGNEPIVEEGTYEEFERINKMMKSQRTKYHTYFLKWRDKRKW